MFGKVVVLVAVVLAVTILAKESNDSLEDGSGRSPRPGGRGGSPRPRPSRQPGGGRTPAPRGKRQAPVYANYPAPVNVNRQVVDSASTPSSANVGSEVYNYGFASTSSSANIPPASKVDDSANNSPSADSPV